MCRYRKIDLEQWARKEHYLYYTNSLNVEVNMTANMDVSELLSFCHTNGIILYLKHILFAWHENGIK